MCSSTLLAVTPTHQPIGTVRPVVRLLSSYRNYTSTHRLQVNTLRALDREDGGCTGVFEPTRPVASATVTYTPAHDHRLIMGGRPSSSAECSIDRAPFSGWAQSPAPLRVAVPLPAARSRSDPAQHVGDLPVVLPQERHLPLQGRGLREGLLGLRLQGRHGLFELQHLPLQPDSPFRPDRPAAAGLELELHGGRHLLTTLGAESLHGGFTGLQGPCGSEGRGGESAP